MPQGVTSASLIVVILIGAAVGAAVGGMLGTTELSPPLIALASGFIATVVAVIARNKLLYRLSGAGPDDTRMPTLVGVFAIHIRPRVPRQAEHRARKGIQRGLGRRNGITNVLSRDARHALKIIEPSGPYAILLSRIVTALPFIIG